MEEEVIIVIKPKRAAAKAAPETHVFDTVEEAYLFLGERADKD
jgi:hypothetical protein